jgi:hypothetical protein
MGRYGFVYGWLAPLPGLRTLRAPARHLVLFQLAMSAIAAVVFEDLVSLIRRGERTEWRRLWPIAITIAASVALTVGAGALASSPWSTAHGLMFSSVARATPSAVIVIGIALLVATAARGVGWSVPVLIVCVALDQGLWGYSYAYRWGPVQSLAALTETANVPQEAQRGELLAPAIEGGVGNLAVLRGMRLTPGYTGLAPASVLDIADPDVQRIAGVDWRETADGHWLRVPNRMTRARLVSTVQHSGDVPADVHRIDISRVALVDRDITVSGVPGSARVLEDRPGSIVVETRADGPQLLVLTERFHGGWRATQDSQPREPVRVYGDFLGCVVDAGQHRVALTFAPASATYGVGATLTGLVLTIVATTVLWPARARSVNQQDGRVTI